MSWYREAEGELTEAATAVQSQRPLEFGFSFVFAAQRIGENHRAIEMRFFGLIQANRKFMEQMFKDLQAG